MILPRNRLSRLDRANETKTREKSLADMINETAGAPAKETPRKATAKAVPPAEPAKIKPKPAKVAPAKSPSVKSPPPPPAQWHEEMLGWRSHGPRPPPFYDDGVRYETIHEYDPLESAWQASDYDGDE
jgi:hypothetical protein